MSYPDPAIGMLLRAMLALWGPAQYCAGAHARTATGTACAPGAAEATRWCLQGLYLRLAPGSLWQAMWAALTAELPPGRCLSQVNDLDGHTAARALVQRALTRWETQQRGS